jgi:hypothetical protein
MANEYDYKCEGFELKAVPRSEFEALKRFGDYTELQDGTLMRREGDMEFRIYRDDVEGCPIHIVTEGVLKLLRIYATMRPEKRMMQASKGGTPGANSPTTRLLRRKTVRTPKERY